MIKDDFDIHCNLVFTLPPSNDPKDRAEDILFAVRKIADRLGKMTFKELNVEGAGAETFLVNGPVLGYIYGMDGPSERIPNTKKLRVEVNADRTISVTEE